MIFVGSLASTAPRFGLAHDEDLSARRAIVGEYIVTEDGSVLRPELKWRNTSFDYRKPTNHVLYSVRARSAWTAWAEFAPAGDWQIREWAQLCLPACLAGTSAVLILALLVAKIGGEMAGRDIRLGRLASTPGFCATLLRRAAIFSLLLLLVPGMLLFGYEATRENLWRWWLGFGARQFLGFCGFIPPRSTLRRSERPNGLVAHQGVDPATGRDEISPSAGGEFDGGDGSYASDVAIGSATAQPLRPAPEARQPLNQSWLVELSSNLLVGTGYGTERF